ncbi:MAG: putative manganese-dependent inorganic diphosphatase [Tissierellia bacterium]|nr:putative manganese-dependent inorganic diphosphatase [Tissierellia bacterium]
MKEKVYILGHKNPDSDSICAALAYAEYKNASGKINAIPARLGELNRETKFILDYFGVEPPMLLETVRLSVNDLNIDRVAPVSPDIYLGMALDLMKKNNLNSLPVANDKEQLIGIVSISDIISSYIDVWDSNVLGKAGTSLENIIDTLSADIVVMPANTRTFDGKILVLAMEPKTAQRYIEENDIVICGDRADVQDIALNSNISLMIVTGDSKVDEKIVDKAREKGVIIISTPHDTFTTSRLISKSVPIKNVMTSENIIKFSLDDLVDNVREHMSQTRYRSYPVVDSNSSNRVVGLISRYHLISSMKKKVILVDHNERSQSVDGIEECEILEIIDHHRIADVFTGNPIYFRNEPVGSTSTIVASIMFENGRRPSKKIAGILAAAIISDTLLLRSPTSTNTDKIMLDRLAKIANLDVEEFAHEMFKAGTSLKGRTPKELLEQDFKTFHIDDEKMGIAQVFTTDPESIQDMKDELIALMEDRADKEKYSIFMLMLTDIIKEASEIVVVGTHKELAAQAFGQKLVNNSFYASGVLSRKKQVVPPVMEYLSDIKEYGVTEVASK